MSHSRSGDGHAFRVGLGFILIFLSWKYPTFNTPEITETGITIGWMPWNIQPGVPIPCRRWVRRESIYGNQAHI